MVKFKSIFAKQFTVYIGTLVISFLLVGFALSTVVSDYFVKQKTEALIEQGEKMAADTALFLNNWPGSSLSMEYRVRALSNLGASCFILNDKSQVKGFTSDMVGITMSQEIIPIGLESVMEKGEIDSTQGNMGGIFSEMVLTVGYPIIVNEQVIGALFMSSPINQLQRNIGEFSRLTIVCLLASLAVSFVLVYISSKTISRPIYQINQAAKEIASGDFEKRLTVKSLDEVGQLAESFNNMAESLENTEKTRREFISNISHDLRSPLTSMRGFLQAILDGTIPEESRDKYLGIVLEESERLSKLANDLLDLNRLQETDIALERTNFDINELIRKTVIMMEKQVTDKRIHMEISFENDKDIVNGDYEKIQRVIYNLVDNAIKFTAEDGNISISTKTSGHKIICAVKDNGKGVVPEEQKKIFERFYKSDASRGEDKKGSGLGLAIVREFVKAHGETICLTSKPGEGSDFSFSLSKAEESID